MTRLILIVLVLMSALCVAGAERSRVITSVTHTTQIHHRVVSTDTDSTSMSSYVTDHEEVRDGRLKAKQGHEIEAVNKEQCTDFPFLGLLQGDTRHIMLLLITHS